MLYKVQGKGLNKLEDTTLERESLLEENLSLTDSPLANFSMCK